MKKITAILICCLILFSGCKTAPPADFADAESLICYDRYEIIPVSQRPLFAADGSVNADVRDALAAILANPLLDPFLREPKTQWASGAEFAGTPYIALTARDFSRAVVGNTDAAPDSREVTSRSGAIVIRLFESVPGRGGAENRHLSELTNQWWQLVYRSVDGENDVLTLWAMQPYRLSYHSGERYENVTGYRNERYFNRQIGFGNGAWQNMRFNPANTIASDAGDRDFFLEANYSRSIARANLLRDSEGLLEHFGEELRRHLVAPRDVPGAWQTSAYQTGTNSAGQYFVSGQFYTSPGAGQRNEFIERFPGSPDPNDGSGATGLIWGSHLHFSLGNGMDGLSVGPVNGSFPNTAFLPTHEDLLWLPSDFEIRTMGHRSDPATFQTFIAEPGNPDSPLRFNWGKEEDACRDNDPRNDITGGRSGLWQLNGYDRGFNSAADAVRGDHEWESKLCWLRTADGIAFGSANTVCHAGNRYSYGVVQRGGMRPAIHLSLTELFL
jgi:hypothetical protein